MAYNFPKIELTADEKMWLGIVCNHFLRGYRADVDLIKKSLYEQGRWPKGLRPSEIDYRLLSEKNKPTLLGIWHVDPSSEWAAKCDHLIRIIKDRVSESGPVEIKVADLAKELGIPERSVSVLIHLLPSISLFYTATIASPRHDVVRIPGQLDMYTTLSFNDPEVIDDYLNYESLEEQIKKVWGEDEADESDTTTRASLDGGRPAHANELYDRVKSLIRGDKPLDENTARIVVELSDDAIKEFGSTNQEKKVELRRWKAQAELSLSPATIEELRKRTEGQLLKSIYPKKSVALRNALFVVVALTIIIPSVLALRQFFSGKTAGPITAPSPSSTHIQPTDKDAKDSPQVLPVTPTPHVSVTPPPTPTPSRRTPPSVEAAPEVRAEQNFNLNSLTNYLRIKMPDREQGSPANMSELLEELRAAGYRSIFDVDRMLDSASEAFKLYEIEHSQVIVNGKFADVGVVRISASIADDNYLRAYLKSSSHQSITENDLIRERAKYSKYKPLLK